MQELMQAPDASCRIMLEYRTGYFGVKLVVQRAGTLLAGLGGLQPLDWDPPLIQLTALPAGRYRRDAPYRQRHSGFRELTHTKPPTN